MKNSTNKVSTFLRRNALYFILAFCILAIGLSVTLMLVTRDDAIQVEKPIDLPNEQDEPDEPDLPDEPDEPDQPTPPVFEEILFIMPVAEASLIHDYSDTPVFNQTLRRYASHLAIDFVAPEGSDVFAVYGGTVESVTTTFLTGTTVVIDHGNSLKTVYNSLTDGESVIVGQTVAQGDVIGTVSASNRQEYKDGAHLHFAVEENGLPINPEKYLVLDEK